MCYDFVSLEYWNKFERKEKPIKSKRKINNLFLFAFEVNFSNDPVRILFHHTNGGIF